MPHIEQLSPHIANLIAAGEVVERPASVVKELLENAIDAGARNVTVELQNGGLTYLRVTDDGCGIAPDELPTAFLRHATSKLRTAADLAAIGTLGFRGEALAAIASVSHLDIFSRQTGAASGATLHLDGGKPLSVEPAGCPEGTSIIVRDLFYNTPARLKFMKQDRAEATAIAGLAAHIALSHPDISFRLIKDGREELHTPGDGKPLSAVYAALGRDFALALVESGVPRTATAMQAIGYKECLGCLAGECTQDEAVAEIKLRSRQYAKRQLTWLRRNRDIHWFYRKNSRDLPAALQFSTEILTNLGVS